MIFDQHRQASHSDVGGRANVPVASEPTHFPWRGVEYKILAQLSLPERGRWLVRDPRPYPKGTDRVALILPNNATTAQIKRSLLRLPSHANGFPHLIDHGRYGSNYLLLVEWITGLDVGEYLGRIRNNATVRPSLPQVVALVRGLAHNLRLLHDVSGLVHADLKPANLIIKVKPRCLRLIDFGTSWQIERTRNRMPGDGFDPIYAAPEMTFGNTPLMGSVDQFAVGVLFYQLLTLKLPYVGLGGRVGFHDYAADSDSLWEAPSRFVSDRDKIPASILRLTDEICHRMLRLNPRDRYANSRAWSNALDHLHVRIQQAAFERGDRQSVLDRFYEWWVNWTLKLRSRRRA